MPVYEMIETIILSFLRSGLTSGAFGSVSASYDDATAGQTFTVAVATGGTYTVRTTRNGWAVTNGEFTGEDRTLIDAGWLAFNP